MARHEEWERIEAQHMARVREVRELQRRQENLHRYIRWTIYAIVFGIGIVWNPFPGAWTP